MKLLAGLAALSLFGAEVKHGYADSGGVKIHYATMGQGPLVVMIHGFPDYWYTWRHQMETLAPSFQVVAMDNRGYNLSDKPKGVENYDMRFLVGDVACFCCIENDPLNARPIISTNYHSLHRNQ